MVQRRAEYRGREEIKNEKEGKSKEVTEEWMNYQIVDGSRTVVGQGRW